MEETRKSPQGWIISILIGFVLGAVFGLYIGWIAWPVTWQNATPAILDANSRQLYLRAAIDSYMVNQDADLAKERYDSLGEYSSSTLSAIYSNPLNQTPQAVQAFANAVGAMAVLQSPPGVPPNASQPAVGQATSAAPGETTPAAPGEATPTSAGGGTNLISGLLMPGLLACLALLLGLGLILFLFSRGRKRTRSRTAENPTPPSAAYEAAPPDRATLRLDETSSPAPSSEPATPGEIPDWLQEAAPSQPSPAPVEAAAAFDLPPAEPMSTDLPDWLQETAVTRGVAEPPAPAAPATTAEEELPDWLRETAIPAPAPQPARPAPVDDLPDWLNEPAAPAVWEPQETSEQTHAKFSQDLSGLPAMEPEFARRLRAAGVSMPMMLLKKGATPESRLKLAEKAGVDAAELATWVNVVDLFRVRGLNTEHAVLLDGVGVRGVSDLAAADPASLTEELDKINQEANLLTQSPGLAEVTHWIGQAKQLPPAIQPG